jgi:glycosyltransferase involved in cell wall biosynthesis
MSLLPVQEEIERTVSRNAACPCNSGLRYKHCCALPDNSATQALARHEHKRNFGLMLQRRGDFSQAIETYDAILREQRADWDVAHMRATCYYQLGAMNDARLAFAALLATPVADTPGYWTNLGLLLASICADQWSPSLRDKLTTYRRFRPNGPTRTTMPMAIPMPTVSVVMPAYMHAHFVGEAIASVFAQTNAPLEFIVIDDGSRDATVECCRMALRDAPFPVRFIARENRGAAFTLNQGIELAKGEFIQLLNSDDRLPPQRIAMMLAALGESDAKWGYGRVALINRYGLPVGPLADARAAELMAVQDAAMMSNTLGLAMLRANSAISSGNLMFCKRLWQALGGFRDYRYNHDWDFCLRATLLCEPVLVPHAMYEYRIHGCNTITESGDAARNEWHRVIAAFIEHAHGQSDWPNPFAPTLDNWDGEVLALLGATDAIRHLPRAVIAQALLAPGLG